MGLLAVSTRFSQTRAFPGTLLRRWHGFASFVPFVCAPRSETSRALPPCTACGTSWGFLRPTYAPVSIYIHCIHRNSPAPISCRRACRRPFRHSMHATCASPPRALAFRDVVAALVRLNVSSRAHSSEHEIGIASPITRAPYARGRMPRPCRFPPVAPC